MPLFFSGEMINAYLFLNTFLAFLAFSFAASAVYIFNDFLDLKDDLIHPRKRFRPIASGEIDKKNAILIMLVLASFGVFISTNIIFHALIVIIIYFIINIAYSVYLKNVVILDVNVIAFGFVLRIWLGAIVTDVNLSIWIVILTYLLALFLALAKRRDDVLIFLNSGLKMRKVIDAYNIKFINITMIILAAVIVMTYILFTLSNEVQLRIQNEHLYLTVLFVLLGLIKYLQLAFFDENTASPVSIILNDRFIQLMVFLWVLSYSFILYL
ncbi:prenyltransferase UbiA [Candidatus Pseudothioglobus singularis PS1]|uniref:Prenyltransferase UbiA n=2 Tax=Candidatus Pseudothioglobus TaxID=2841677 RepID=A0A0M5KT69_9GAMM|nr:prenyltransferase UbiA [Candidatus Pseudothioglobus singularis PS1]